MKYLKKVWNYKYQLLAAILLSGVITTLAIAKRYIPQRYEAKVEFRLNSKLTSGILTEKGEELFLNPASFRRQLQESGETLAAKTENSKVIVTLDGSNKYTILARSSKSEDAYDITTKLFDITKDSILAFTARTPFGHQMERHENYVNLLEKGIEVYKESLMADSGMTAKTRLIEDAYKCCMDTVTAGLKEFEPTESPLNILYKTTREEVKKSLSPAWYILLSMAAALAVGLMVILMYDKRSSDR